MTFGDGVVDGESTLLVELGGGETAALLQRPIVGHVLRVALDELVVHADRLGRALERLQTLACAASNKREAHAPFSSMYCVLS